MKKIVPALLVLVAASLLLFYYPRKPQNIILITIDTLRADHLNLYGYQRETAPELSSRASKGVVYERALVQWPKTVPSMVSMFSSTYAHTNGILFGSRGQYIEDKLTLLPEVLQQHGFATYGIVSNAVLADETNFSQGFDVYKETWLDTSRGKEHSRADHVTDMALEALNQLKGKRFFLWIHYVDPHYQYRPPAPYDKMFVGDSYYNKDRVLKINVEDNNYYDGIAKRIWQEEQNQEWDYYIAQYDAEVRFLDDHLKRLFSQFDQQGIWKNSIVGFTADHGESLGENHYFFEHGWFPYTSCSRAPLILWDPARKARRVSDSVALLDLAPTLLERMKIAIPKSFEGLSWDTGTPRPVFIEVGEGGLNRMNYIRSLWTWPYHLVYVPSENYQRMMQKSLFELYNVEKDPYEAHNILAEEPAKAKELERQLLKWIQASPTYTPPTKKTPDYDPEAIEQMEALGYLQ